MKKKLFRFTVTIICIAAAVFMLMPTAQASGSVLRPGSSGSEVKAMQDRLQQLGYADYAQGLGNYGARTRNAVMRFQRNNGLIVDGIAGPQTLDRLYSNAAARLVLRAGDSGEAVQALQLRLKSLGYFPGTGTGHFGALTLGAIRDFQRANGLVVDGIAGPQTRIAAFSGSAPAPSAPSPSAAAIADIALSQNGKPYAWGGNGPSSYDCSGLAYYAMTQAGFHVSRLSSAGYSAVSSWQRINGTGGLKRGDLLFFRSDTSSHIGHMGVYTGNMQFIHASSGQGRVMVSTLDNVYWARNYLFARRVG